MDADDRERLKQEYKEHFKKVKELKQKLRDVQRNTSITDALEKMNPESLLNTFDEMMDKVKDKVNLAEAKLEIALEEFKLALGEENEDEDEPLEETPHQKAKRTVDAMKKDMETDHQQEKAGAQPAGTSSKTIGRKGNQPASESTTRLENQLGTRKTIGKKRDN